MEGLEKIRDQARSEDRGSVDPSNPFVAKLIKSVWPIIAILDNEWRVSGTGFLISRGGLMLTARHVITDASRNARKSRDGARWRYDAVFLAMYGGSPNNRVEQPRLFCIAEVTSALSDDVAVCQLRPIDQVPFEFRPLKLRPTPPNVGEEVLAFGYDELGPSRVSDLVDQQKLDVKANGHFASGRVEAVYWQGKPSGLGTFPCFDFTASVPPGMSGGPVIDERGFVCGVVSHSRTWERSATAAALALALGAELSIPEGPDGPARDATLYDLLREGVVEHDGSLDRIHVDYLPGGEFRVVLSQE